ncbi:MAG: amidohydrolase family protein [Clostridia bacterium]|nr:amidohydrolase family protein [Clostridia bacterium]
MFDCHMHYSSDLDPGRFLRVIETCGYDAVALQCICKGNTRVTRTDAFAFRDLCAARLPSCEVRIFGGMDPAIYRAEQPDLIREGLISCLRELLTAGCDGIKLLEGKPNIRKMFRVPDFDGEVWAGFWEEAERRQVPVVMHVNDPEEFWTGSPDASPEEIAFRKRSGWMYDETYPNNEDQYGQMERVLERHPRLKILFPHFFFMSRQLPRLGDLLTRFPGVMTDLTPGVELFLNLSDQIEEARRFFERFQDRICYGTDIGSRQVILEEDALLNMEETASRVRLVKGFLFSERPYILTPDAYYRGPGEKQMQPLLLTETQKQKILDGNFRRFISDPVGPV